MSRTGQDLPAQQDQDGHPQPPVLGAEARAHDAAAGPSGRRSLPLPLFPPRCSADLTTMTSGTSDYPVFSDLTEVPAGKSTLLRSLAGKMQHISSVKVCHCTLAFADNFVLVPNDSCRKMTLLLR